MTIDIDDAINALLAYQQADMEGTMVLTSRQAIHEVANEIRRIRAVAQPAGVRDALIAAKCTSPDGTYVHASMDAVLRAIAAQPPAAPVETDEQPVAYAVFTDSGNIRLWSKTKVEIETWAKGKNKVVTPLYMRPAPVPHSSAGNGDETGWLIENDDPPVYCVLSDDYDEHWTSDASKALRFARREDAQAYSDHVGWTSPPVRIAEHMWPALEPMPRGGMKVDWWEQSVLYRRRLRALIKLVEKEGYSVSSDGRNGMPMALARTGDQPQTVQHPVAYQRRAMKGNVAWSGWYMADDEPTPENMKFDGVLEYEYRPLYAGSPLSRPQHSGDGK